MSSSNQSINDLKTFADENQSSPPPAASVAPITKVITTVLADDEIMKMEGASETLFTALKVVLRASQVPETLHSASTLLLLLSSANFDILSSVEGCSCLTNLLYTGRTNLKLLSAFFTDLNGLTTLLHKLTLKQSAILSSKHLKILHLLSSLNPSISSQLPLATLIPVLSSFLLLPNTSPTRSKIIVETLRISYALYAHRSKELASLPSMTIFGVLLVKIIHRNDSALADCVKLCSLQAKEFSGFLLINNCLPILVDFLNRKLTKVIVEKDGNPVVELSAILTVLKKCVDINPIPLKQIVFPPEIDEELVSQDKSPTAPASQKNLHPLDAPKYTLRYLLIKLMTHKDTDVKRIVSELMWSMCGKDEFVNRVGFGNAVWWLSVMGVVKVPGVA
ncbi:hypothetical protein TrST_g10300 [Triparma strigata]|uniref:Uncharacterized protein n=1 Tax=Triparma strigata TaxID=1606541 RepID=A0A9W7BCS9_9STRA|nr:hypothetical protein TrST_g10300 [Triparma strigata]